MEIKRHKSTLIILHLFLFKTWGQSLQGPWFKGGWFGKRLLCPAPLIGHAEGSFGKLAEFV